MSPQQHSRSMRSRWLLGLALLPLGAGLLVGCDTAADKADVQARADLDAAAAANPYTPEGRAKAHQSLDAAAKNTEATPATQARAKALLADAELAEASDIARAVADNTAVIERLARQATANAAAIATDNRLVEAMNKREPQPALTALKAEATEMTGSEEKPDWRTTESGPLGAQFAADKGAAAAQQQVDQLEQQIKTDTDQRNELLAKADQLGQQSRKERGDKSLELYTQGADARKQADDLAAKLGAAQAQLAAAKADLAVQQGHGSSIKTALGRVEQGTSAVQEAWTAVGLQVKGVKEHAASVLGDGTAVAGTAQPTTLSARAAMIAELQKKNRDLRAEADTHFGNAAKFYQDAVEQATAVRTELGDEKHLGGTRPDRADRLAWTVQRDVIDPGQYRYDRGTALLARANFYAAAAAEAKTVADLATAVKGPVSAAGLTVPPSLDDAGGDAAGAAKKSRDEAVAGFTESVAAFGKVGEGDASQDVKRAAGLAKALAEYGWSAVLAAAGDANGAAGHLAEARSAKETAVANGAMLPTILPAALATPVAAPAAPAGTPPTATPPADPQATPAAGTPAPATPAPTTPAPNE